MGRISIDFFFFIKSTDLYPKLSYFQTITTYTAYTLLWLCRSPTTLGKGRTWSPHVQIYTDKSSTTNKKRNWITML